MILVWAERQPNQMRRVRIQAESKFKGNMPANTVEAKQQAHQLVDQLGPDQLHAVVQLLEVMVHQGSDEDEDIMGDDDLRAIAASRGYFRKNSDGGIPFEQVGAECGFTMEQIRGHEN